METRELEFKFSLVKYLGFRIEDFNLEQEFEYLNKLQRLFYILKSYGLKEFDYIGEVYISGPYYQHGNSEAEKFTEALKNHEMSFLSLKEITKYLVTVYGEEFTKDILEKLENMKTYLTEIVWETKKLNGLVITSFLYNDFLRANKVSSMNYETKDIIDNVLLTLEESRFFHYETEEIHQFINKGKKLKLIKDNN